MKKYLFTLASMFYFVLISVQAQIKIQDDNHVSIGSLTKSYGIQVQPNGYAYFQSTDPNPYAWMNLTYANHSASKCYIVQYGTAHTFFVNGDGCQYSAANFIDGAMSQNVSALYGDSVLAKILQLKSILYKLKDYDTAESVRITDKYGHTNMISKTGSGDNSTNPFIDPNVARILEGEKKREYIGMVAEEVEKVIPELVRTKPDGTKSIAYYSLTSLLVDAIKEQQSEIEQLKRQFETFHDQTFNNYSGNFKSAPNSTDGNLSDSGGILFQNQPNPFSEKTTIRYKIGDASKKIAIFIFNLQGTLVKSFENLDSGAGEIVISGNDLKAGMYLYSLILDGREADTKRMILTN